MAVVECGSFSAAAEKLYLSQPTVTTHVNALEKELGQQLLVRNARGQRVTQAGQKCYEYARSAIEQRNAFLREFGCRDGDAAVHILASSVPAQFYLPELLAHYRAVRPQTRFSVTQCDSRNVAARLREQPEAIGFCGFPPTDKNCASRPVAEDRLVVAAPNIVPYTELPANEPFPMELLLHSPMISRAPTSGTRMEFERYLRGRGCRSGGNIVIEMADSQAIIQAVASGMGIAVLSQYAAADYASLGRVKCFALPDDPPRSLYMLKWKGQKLPSTTEHFYRFVLQQGITRELGNNKSEGDKTSP